MGPASAKKPTADGTSRMSASLIVFVASAATPGRSPAAASLDALGSMAVVRETVISEWGRIQMRWALE